MRLFSSEHFKADHFGLVHSIINGAFDASTVMFTILEQMHAAGRALPECMSIFEACSGSSVRYLLGSSLRHLLGSSLRYLMGYLPVVSDTRRRLVYKLYEVRWCEAVRAGATTRALFIGMACLAVVYLLLSSEWVWAGYLEPPQSEEAKEAKEAKECDGASRPSNVPFTTMKNENEIAATAPVETNPKGDDDKGEGGGVGASEWPAGAGSGAAAPAAAAPAAPQFGPLLDCSGQGLILVRFSAQRKRFL